MRSNPYGKNNEFPNIKNLLYSAAKDYLEQGFSVIPIMSIPETGRKVALVKWQEY